MRVGVDQSRNQQAVRGIDAARILRDGLVRLQYRNDLVAIDQEIGKRAVEPPRS